MSFVMYERAGLVYTIAHAKAELKHAGRMWAKVKDGHWFFPSAKWCWLEVDRASKMVWAIDDDGLKYGWGYIDRAGKIQASPDDVIVVNIKLIPQGAE